MKPAMETKAEYDLPDAPRSTPTAAIVLIVVLVGLSIFAALVGFFVFGWLVVRVDRQPASVPPPRAKYAEQVLSDMSAASSVSGDTGDFDGRLRAATMVQDQAQREEAFSAIAEDAARRANPAVAQQAIQMIRSGPLRDAAVDQAARRLSEAGLVKDAIQLTALISQVEMQAATFVELAQNAARSGDMENASEALRRISDTTLRDNTAAAVAKRLAAVGNSDAAIHVANTFVSNSELRDKTLAAIAKGTD